MRGRSSSSSASLPKQFVESLRVLFEILDPQRDGVISLSEIVSKWRELPTKHLPSNFLTSLSKVAPTNGLLTFERFLAGVQLSLQQPPEPFSAQRSFRDDKSAQNATLKRNNSEGRILVSPHPADICGSNYTENCLIQHQKMFVPITENKMANGVGCSGGGEIRSPAPTMGVYAGKVIAAGRNSRRSRTNGNGIDCGTGKERIRLRSGSAKRTPFHHRSQPARLDQLFNQKPTSPDIHSRGVNLSDKQAVQTLHPELIDDEIRGQKSVKKSVPENFVSGQFLPKDHVLLSPNDASNEQRGTATPNTVHTQSSAEPFSSSSPNCSESLSSTDDHGQRMQQQQQNEALGPDYVDLSKGRSLQQNSYFQSPTTDPNSLCSVVLRSKKSKRRAPPPPTPPKPDQSRRPHSVIALDPANASFSSISFNNEFTASTSTHTNSASSGPMFGRNSSILSSTPTNNGNYPEEFLPQVAKHENLLDEEFAIVSRGIEAARELLHWYSSRTESLEKRKRMLSKGIVSLDSAVHEQKLNFYRALICELNRRIKSLIVTNDRDFPSHNNMQIREQVLPPPKLVAATKASTPPPPKANNNIQSQHARQNSSCVSGSGQNSILAGPAWSPTASASNSSTRTSLSPPDSDCSSAAMPAQQRNRQTRALMPVGVDNGGTDGNQNTQQHQQFALLRQLRAQNQQLTNELQVKQQEIEKLSNEKRSLQQHSVQMLGLFNKSQLKVQNPSQGKAVLQRRPQTNGSTTSCEQYKQQNYAQICKDLPQGLQTVYQQSNHV